MNSANQAATIDASRITGLLSIKDGNFLINGAAYRTILFPSKQDDLWRKINDSSINEYIAHHENDAYPDSVKTIAKLFEGFIAKTLLAPHPMLVLDVGCGIGTKFPLYFRGIRNGNIEYMGLDPIEINFSRTYPFICAKIEDVVDHATIFPPINIFIFATSLDHFQDLDYVAMAVRQLAATGAKAIFWIGLHDPDIVAQSIGSSLFARLFAKQNIFVILAKWLAYSAIYLPRLILSMAKRKKMLQTKQPLDEHHFHYFVRQKIASALSKFGELDEIIEVPGTNSIFVVVGIQDTNELGLNALASS